MIRPFFKTAFALLDRSLVHSRGTAAPLTWKRLGVLLWLLPGALLLQVSHWIGFLLDDVFFRGWRDVEVKEPIFVIGMPRSGTTHLHHVLAKDEDGAAAFTLWELLLAPSITERKVVFALAAVDRVLGGLGRRLAKRVDDRLFHDVRHIHWMSLFDPEEDELCCIPIFRGTHIWLALPYDDVLGDLFKFDDEVPPCEQRRIMAHYKACVQKLLYVRGPHKRFISKNPSFSGRVDAIYDAFPGARIVCCVRTPYEALPSWVSLNTFTFTTFASDLGPGNRLNDMLFDQAKHFYRHPIKRLPEYPEDRQAFLMYTDLRTNAKGTVETLFKRFGFELRPEYAARLEGEQKKAKSYKSRHAYSLDEYGLTQDRIAQEFHDVIAHFGFPPPEHDA